MFTGIVQSQAKVISIKTQNNLCKLVISINPLYAIKLELGASIAINGVCLTVVEFFEQPDKLVSIAFDVIEETLRVTTLGMLTVGDLVNVERSLKMGDELGGHIVSGHVHYMSTLVNRVDTATNTTLYFECVTPWLKYVFDKGFITLNGTSLTVGELKDNTFSVHLIPETLSRTNLGKLVVGNKINIEFDQQTITIVKTIERLKLNM